MSKKLNEKYALCKEKIAGKIEKVEEHIFYNHLGSYASAGISLLAGAVSTYAIPEFIKELNGVVPMDPDSPMFIPAASGVIIAVGALGVAIKRRVEEDRDLRESYARQLEIINLNKQRQKLEQERIQRNRESVMDMFMNNPFANTTGNEDSHSVKK